MRRKTKTWYGHLLAVFFPERCACCGQVIAYARGYCPRCAASLPRMEGDLCPQCGQERTACRCRQHRPQFDRCALPFWYDGVMRQGILRYKKEARPYITALFARELAETVRREYGEEAFTCVVPVPMYEAAQKERGFNPVALLARELAEQLGVPYAEPLVKILDTPAQKELPAARRRGNLIGAFDLRGGADVRQARILLVDDVITTGSTLDECAKMLKLYGAQRVCAICLAGTRAPERRR